MKIDVTNHPWIHSKSPVAMIMKVSLYKQAFRRSLLPLLPPISQESFKTFHIKLLEIRIEACQIVTYAIFGLCDKAVFQRVSFATLSKKK